MERKNVRVPKQIYDISYWKIDGMLLKPDTEDESGPYGYAYYDGGI